MALLPSVSQFFTSIPPATRLFTFTTIAASLFYLWIRWPWSDDQTIIMPYLLLVPGSSLFYPWTFVTAAFVETSVFEFLATMVFVPPSLRYLERLWGTSETLKFILVSTTIPNLITFAINWVEFAATKNADLFLYGMQYHGQMALQVAILVAFTQLIPEHQVQVMGVIKSRVKKLPMAYVTLSTILTIAGFQCPWILIQFGWYVSWVYLRFYKRSPGDAIGGGDVYGDRSETFALVSWFPPFLHTPLTLLANFVHRWATRLRLIPSANLDLESGGGHAQLPGAARAEAERRRAMALKALDQRLANSASTTSSGSGVGQPQTPRPPATSSTSNTSNNEGTGHSMTRASERKKSVSDADNGDEPEASEHSR